VRERFNAVGRVAWTPDYRFYRMLQPGGAVRDFISARDFDAFTGYDIMHVQRTDSYLYIYIYIYIYMYVCKYTVT